MGASDVVTIKVKRGIKVEVHEVDKLEGDRVLVAEAPKGLKIAVHQVSDAKAPASPGGITKITMCG